jgi:hypothetical protein
MIGGVVDLYKINEGHKQWNVVVLVGIQQGFQHELAVLTTKCRSIAKLELVAMEFK